MHVRKMAGMAVAAMLLAAGAGRADITIETVPVGDAGNAGDTRYYSSSAFGAVGYTYNIGKYEVTAGQYAAFLNAVAKTDPYGLYNPDMSNTSYGSGITRGGEGAVGDLYTYSVAPDFANRPVNFVSWGDSVRFANWLTNGKPTGVQGPGTTEDGAYSLNGAITNEALLAVVAPSAAQRATWSSGAKPYFLLTSENEWYKAAYYKGGGTNAGYWDYPTRSDTRPGRDMADLSGNNANTDYGLFYPDFGSYPIDSDKYTTVAGAFHNSAGPYGTFDQAGNVCEWNETILSFGGVTGRGLRGGSYSYLDWADPQAMYYAYYPPTYEFQEFGFRISVVPEPGSAALVVFGGLALFRRYRRK